MRKLAVITPVILLIIFLLIAKASQKNMREDFLGHLPLLGSNEAPVHMLLFEDLTCESCTYFQNEIFPFIQKNYIDSNQLKVSIIPFALFKENKANTINCYCLVDEPNAFFHYIYSFIQGDNPKNPNNCNLKHATKLYNQAMFLNHYYQNQEIQAPFVVINEKPLETLSLASITKRIQQCLQSD